MSKKNQISKIKYSNLTSLYLSVKGFHKNYEDLKKEEAALIGETQYEDMVSVAATNGFLAVELYLKLMYAIVYWVDNEKDKEEPDNYTEFPKGHDIKVMFENLDSRFKDPILNKLSDSMTEEQLLKQLDKYKNGFMEWRYIFERDYMQGDFHFLSKILMAMCSVCRGYMDNYHFPKEEWQQEGSRTSIIMHEKPVNSKEEAIRVANMSLKDVLENSDN